MLLAAACLPTFPAFADGCYFSRVESVAVSSDQRALMIRNGAETSLTLSTAYTGEAEDFAWVIPTPVPLSADGLRETGEKAEGIFSLLDTWTSPSVVKESCCFPAGTGVLTPDGLRPIETVEPGARVVSYDPRVIPTVDLAKMSACFRQRVVAFFVERKLLNERLAKNMLGWTHSGFSVDASIHISAGSEGGTDTVLYRAPYSDYFRTDTKVFPAIEFLVEVLQHVPDSRSRLIPTYRLYSSRARGTPSPTGALARREGGPASPTSSALLPMAGSATIHPSHPSASVRLIKKVYEADPLSCPRCHKPMKVIAVITDPAQVLKILRHLIKKGTPPPGLDPASLN